MDGFARATKIVEPHEAETTLAIDVANLSYRAYFSHQELTTKDGRPSGHVYGAVKLLIHHLKTVGGKVCITYAYEGANATTRRRAMVPSYKMDRDPNRFDPKPDVEKLFRDIPGFHMTSVDCEGDDILAFIATRSNKPVVIVSGDKDTWGLLQYPNVQIFSPNMDRFVTKEDVLEHFLVADPSKVYLYKAVFGDTSDGVAGVYRLFKKQVAPVLNMEECKDIQSFYTLCKTAPSVKPNSLAKISTELERLEKNLQVVTPHVEQAPDFSYTSTDPRNKEALLQNLKSWDCNLEELAIDIQLLFG